MQELLLLDGLPHGRQVRVKSQSRSVLSSDDKKSVAEGRQRRGRGLPRDKGTRVDRVRREIGRRY